MALILSLETSTQVCSVGVSLKGVPLATLEKHDKNSHASALLPLIHSLIEKTGLNKNQLDAVCVSKGPGSYTGLRIGVSTAKGLCYALNIPFIAIDSLTGLASGVNRQLFPSESIIVPMIDARRMEVYSAVFNSQLQMIRPIKAETIDNKSFSEFNNFPLVFIGDGSPKCSEILKTSYPNAYFPDVKPSAFNFAALAYQAYQNQEFEDVAYFEPFYLKDFIAGIPKVKGLR